MQTKFEKPSFLIKRPSHYPFRIGSGPEEEQQLVRWLNDDWLRFGQGGRTKFRSPDGLHAAYEEDLPARKVILNDYLPALREVYEVRHVAALSPSSDPERRVNFERIGKRFVKLRAKLAQYPLILCPGVLGLTDSFFETRGEKAREGWAVHVLFNMAKERRLEKLKVCLRDGCGRWFIARRQIDRFCCTNCRVADYQSNPEFKAERNKQARERYHNVGGIQGKGWNNGKA